MIPARAGSKRLPNKNSKLLNKKPLISYSIEFAKQFKEISEIIVTTNDKKIADLSKKLGANVPELRPASLSTDSTPMYKVLHYVQRTFLSEVDYDYLILLDPTSPARDVKDLKQSIKIMNQNKKLDGIVAVSKPFFNPYWVGVTKSKKNIIVPINKMETGYSTSQEASSYFRINGNFYLWRSGKVLNLDKNYLSKMEIFGFEIDEIRAFSIDTQSEFQILEAYVKYGLVNLDYGRGTQIL